MNDRYIGITQPLNIIKDAYANIDAKYGPYDTVEDALIAIPISLRKEGLTVGILINGVVTEYWFKNGTSDNDLIEKVLSGMIVLRSEWAIGVEYHNDENSTDKIRYLSVALVRDATVETGWRAYRCKVTHISDIMNVPPNSIYWEEFPSNMASIFTSIILATNSNIILTPTNELRIIDSLGNVTAGLSGAGTGATGYRFWSGAEFPADADFSVDELGKLNSKNIDAIGKFSTSSNGYRIVIDPATKSILLYDNSDILIGKLSADLLPVLILGRNTGTTTKLYLSKDKIILGTDDINLEVTRDTMKYISGTTSFEVELVYNNLLKVFFKGLPTTSVGLLSGQLWNDSGVIKIIP